MDKTNDISKDVVVLYFKRLSKRVFKSIPILEGKDLHGRVIYPVKIAEENFKKHVSKLLVEIYGNSSIFFSNEYSIEIIGLLKSLLMDIDIEDRPPVRGIIFDCISLLDKVIKITEEGDGIAL